MPRLTVAAAGGTHGEQRLYDPHERRAGERARDAEVAARVAAARAKAAEACGELDISEEAEAVVPELHQDRPLRVIRDDGPPFVPYVYRGTGRDTLTPPRNAGRPRNLPQAAAPVAPVAPAPPCRCDGCGYLTTAPGHLAECGTP